MQPTYEGIWHPKEPDIITRHYYDIWHIAKGKLNGISLWNFHNTIIWVYVYHWRKLKSFAHFGSFELTFLIHFLSLKELVKRLMPLQSKKIVKMLACGGGLS